MQRTTFSHYVAVLLTAIMLIPATSYADVRRFASPVNYAQKALKQSNRERTLKKEVKLPGPRCKSVPQFKEISNVNKLPVMKRSGVQQVTGSVSGEIYGVLIYASDWSSDTAPYGIYHFDMANSTYSEYALDNILSGPGTYVNGNVYINISTESFGMLLDC